MEDPFRVSKVNTLARELLKHGIASSMDDAIKQAERLVRGESPEDIKNPAPLVSESIPPSEEKKETPQQSSVLKQDNDEDHSKLLKEIDSLKKAIESNKNAISVVTDKMNEIIAEINKIESGSVVQNKPNPSGNQSISPNNKQQTQANLRTGGLQPGDVHIEDYFYSGSKKKN